MNYRLKRILTIIGFIVIVLILAILIYVFLFGGSTNIIQPVPQEPESTTGSLPPAEDGTPSIITPEEEGGGAFGELQPSNIADGGPVFTKQLTTSKIISPNITGNSVNYYDPSDGKFYTIDENGNVVALSNTVFPDAETVEIANSGEIAAIEFPDGSNVLYNFTTETQTTLPKHWEGFGFSTDSEEVASKTIGSDVNNRALVISASDGSRTKTVTQIGSKANKVTVNFSPNNNVVGFSETGSVQSGFGRRQILLLDLDGNDAGGIIVEGGNFSAIWSEDGSHILYSVADSPNNDRPSLWYVNGTGNVGGDKKKMGVETWVEKCTLTSPQTVICAVPRVVKGQSGLDHILIDSFDDVFEISLRTGQPTLLASPVINLQMENLFVSEDGTTLFFTDQGGKLNSIRLK